MQRPPLDSQLSQILIIDDEYAIRLLLDRALTMAGYRVQVAEDGPAGIEIFSKHAEEIGLVMLDLTMPKMDGREVAAQLLALQPEVNVVLMSGHSEGEVLAQFTGLSLAAVIHKPFHPKQMVELVGKILNKSPANEFATAFGS